MMRALGVILIAVGIGAGLWWYKNLYHKRAPQPQKITSPLPDRKTPLASTAIFVPHWSDFEDADFSPYQTVIYFGIVPTTSGINKSEPGYKKLDFFSQSVGDDKERLLTLVMTNSDTNLAILKNKQSWDTIIQEALTIVDNYKFDGLVLDFELSVLPFGDMTDKVTDFVSFFATNTKGRNKHFAIAVYGDTIYRKRPYDISALSRASDEVMIMAYDFHKARGEPGPNFPLTGRREYGYDFQTMIEDFTSLAPPKKLTVVFGMFGYDWLVDEKKRPFTMATSLTLHEIRKKFLFNCTMKNCVVNRDPASAETEVNYVDETAFSQPNIAAFHIIWFEDEKSVESKIEILQEQGIGQIGYWAYGYF